MREKDKCQIEWEGEAWIEQAKETKGEPVGKNADRFFNMLKNLKGRREIMGLWPGNNKRCVFLLISSYIHYLFFVIFKVELLSIFCIMVSKKS